VRRHEIALAFFEFFADRHRGRLLLLTRTIAQRVSEPLPLTKIIQYFKALKTCKELFDSKKFLYKINWVMVTMSTREPSGGPKSQGATMSGHHLVLGELTDYLTGQTLVDTHDERYRQVLARFLVEVKGYAKTSIEPRHMINFQVGDKQAAVIADFLVRIDDTVAMVIKYSPGSIVTRHRPALALSRLVASHQVPVVVVTNGETADVLDGASGAVAASGLEAIPHCNQLRSRIIGQTLAPIAAKRAEIEERILYAYEINDSCVCNISGCDP
jgi:hypothetical protein